MIKKPQNKYSASIMKLTVGELDKECIQAAFETTFALKKLNKSMHKLEDQQNQLTRESLNQQQAVSGQEDYFFNDSKSNHIFPQNISFYEIKSAKNQGQLKKVLKIMHSDVNDQESLQQLKQAMMELKSNTINKTYNNLFNSASKRRRLSSSKRKKTSLSKSPSDEIQQINTNLMTKITNNDVLENANQMYIEQEDMNHQLNNNNSKQLQELMEDSSEEDESKLEEVDDVDIELNLDDENYGIGDYNMRNKKSQAVTAVSTEEVINQVVDEDLLRLLTFCKQIPQPELEEIRAKSISLGPQLYKQTIIFDLDETLISSEITYIPKEFENSNKSNSIENLLGQDGQMPQQKMEPNFCFQLPQGEDMIMVVKVTYRPNLIEMLEYLSSNYEIGIFTASESKYADPILDHIDPLNEFFSFRLYRESCYQYQNCMVKDLRIIQNREMANMIIIDNSIVSFALQLSNGVPINSFNGLKEEKDDQELLYLVQYLEQGQEFDDIRDYNRVTLQLETILEENQQQSTKSSDQ